MVVSTSRLFSSIFRSEEKCLVKVDTPAKVLAEQSMVDHKSIAQVMVGISDMEHLSSQKMFTRAEAKHLMEVINSRSIEFMKSKSKNNDQVKGSFFHEDKNTPCFGSHGAKTLDPSIAPNSVESLSKVPMAPVVANPTIRPRGRSAIYRMARSPYFMIDPLTKKKRGHEFRWNVGGGPSLSRGISTRNLKLLGNQALKRDASFLDDDDGLLEHIYKIPKKSVENGYNEEFLANNESPGSTDATMSSHATLNPRTNLYFRMSAPEYSSSLDEEDYTTDDSIDDSVQSPLGLNRPDSNIPKERNSISKLLAIESHLLTSFKVNDVTCSSEASNSSHATPTSQRNHIT